VLDALGRDSVEDVGTLLDNLEAADYNPFSLLHADARLAWIGYHGSGGIRRERLAPGLHFVVSSLGSDHAGWRTARLEKLLQVDQLAALAPEALVDALAAVLRYHAEQPEPATTDDSMDDSICRHNGEHGTVSSFVALLGGPRDANRLHCAVGSPCRTPYEDYSALLYPSAQPDPPDAARPAGLGQRSR
jgi:hypothetical protein